ncbi:hypothetical protein E6O75_ATG00254 [Venturia nashicola]|uniref:Uncharacterized protein n=1 Tax=Venturia nashicola TaxID=86259 RepID=A0A4Z1PHY7_9PEZI|nr:hypothetical protein E6O75_ATG00254 [Venturia nashicola]
MRKVVVRGEVKPPALAPVRFESCAKPSIRSSRYLSPSHIIFETCSDNLSGADLLRNSPNETPMSMAGGSGAYEVRTLPLREFETERDGRRGRACIHTTTYGGDRDQRSIGKKAVAARSTELLMDAQFTDMSRRVGKFDYGLGNTTCYQDTKWKVQVWSL